MTTTEATRKCGNCTKVREAASFVNAGPRARCAPCRTRERELTYRVEAGVTKSREKHLWAKYRITPEEYDAMRAAQDYSCAICRRHECELPNLRAGRPRLDGSPAAEGFRLVVDHCHNSAKVRGLLCVACNSAIGQMDDSPDRLAAAIRYLTRQDATPAP
ncbi:endonuclease VII domain-containing protein [Micromonospora sp. NBC_00362]|uniref:endonuclease VII domain-containing protein n=1 Tax=Micromonospora sp. NBC_00362 TaxID=2975975 RepID=UPI00225B1C9B|nr:endonuclease VII domain-containing protein [Micromonospora sp. NBC_00362]MCX5119230.1 endonuclease VII domain-containing protein [Micromonospora sp. NBC_00362]